MKKISTLFFILITVAAFSQTNNVPQHLLNKVALKPKAVTGFTESTKYPVHLSRTAKKTNNSASRSQNIAFYMDYGLLDSFYNQYGPNAGGGAWYRDDQFSFRQVNGHLAVDSTAFQKWAITWYPRIIDFVDNSNWPFNEYTPSKIQMNIDTVYVTMGHLHVSSSNDTFVVSVWDLDAFQTISFDTGATGSLLGRLTQIVDSSVLGGTGQGTDPGTFVLGTYAFALPTPAVVPQGHRFLIQIDYFGPSEDAFLLSSTRRNDCASQCGASIPYVNATYNTNIANWNSLFGIRYVDASQNISGIYPSTLFFNDCNNNGVKDSICEELYTQDFDIFPNIKATIPNFYVDALTSATTVCPNTSVTLTANGGGSAAIPYTYSWSASNGSLSSTTDQQVALTTGAGIANDTVIITLTDANSVNTYDTVVIKSGGVKVTISNNPQPIVLSCNQTAVVTTSITGSTLGKNYTWSTGDNGPAKSTITVANAGTYTVTVTNTAGCSATTSVDVSYSGVLNNVNFNLPNTNTPAQHQWAGCDLAFKNTSTSFESPWQATFDPLGNGSDILTFTDGRQFMDYTYASPGVYNAKLTMDSAGCSFTTTKTVQITAKPSNSICDAVGVNNIEFSNGINMMPNPTTGYVHLDITGVEKNITVKVYNILGAEVKSFQSNEIANGNFSKDLDLSAFANGTYLVRIDSADKTAIKKLVISK